MFGIFNVRTDVDAHGSCTDTVRESALEVDCGKTNPLPHHGLEPASVLRRAFQSDALPTELSPPLFCYEKRQFFMFYWYRIESIGCFSEDLKC